MAFDEAAATTPLLPNISDKTGATTTTTTTTYQYDAIINTLTEEDRESIRKMVAKDLVRRAAEDISRRSRYRHIADTTEVFGKILAGLTSILAFSATAFPDENRMLSFLAGIVGTVGVVLSGWSHYASKESDERLTRLNVILKGLGLSPVPADSDSTATTMEVDAPTSTIGPQQVVV